MQCEEIRTKNNIYQHFYVLKTNRNKRHRYGEFLVEGVRNLNEAVTGLESGKLRLSRELMRELSGKEDTAELMAVVEMRQQLIVLSVTGNASSGE